MLSHSQIAANVYCIVLRLKEVKLKIWRRMYKYFIDFVIGLWLDKTSLLLSILQCRILLTSRNAQNILFHEYNWTKTWEHEEKNMINEIQGFFPFLSDLSCPFPYKWAYVYIVCYSLYSPVNQIQNQSQLCLSFLIFSISSLRNCCRNCIDDLHIPKLKTLSTL